MDDQETMNDEEPINPRADVLAKVFTGRLHVRYEKMAQAFALCRESSADDARWIELQRQLDALADAAASFGFGTLAVHAGSLALRIADLLAQAQRHAHDIDEIGRTLMTMQNPD